MGILFSSKIFAFEEVLVKLSGVYSWDGYMVAVALNLHSSITCSKDLFQNNKNGSKHGIGIIRLGFPFTMGIDECNEMLLKILVL